MISGSGKNARALCVQALVRWENGREFADDILHESLSRAPLPPLDRAFLTEVFYGILRNLSLLDFWIGQLRDAPLDSETRQLVRLGLYQIMEMRIPSHAAVFETVNIAGRSRGVVNALLRRALRECDAMTEASRRAPAHLRLSHPEHLFARWRKNLGEADAIRLCEWNNQPAEMYARANTLKITADELLRATADAEPFEPHPLMLKVRRVPLSWIVSGLCYVQDPSTLLACELLDPKPGDAVLDACAAPGGKTSCLAAMMRNEGSLIACDASAQRLARLNENLNRLGVTNARTSRVDWLAGGAPFAPVSFTSILLDAPCSNTGVIRRRVDARWRLAPADFIEMPKKQFALLKALAPLLRPGGALVYSTCSLEPEENEGIVERVKTELPSLRFIERRASLPWRDGIDGAFAAKFESV